MQPSEDANEREDPRKRHTADMTVGMPGPMQRDTAYLSGNFPHILGLLESATSTRAPGHQELCVLSYSGVKFLLVPELLLQIV